MDKMDDLHEASSRKYVRTELHEGVIAEMNLQRVDDRIVTSNTCKVLVTNLSPGGLRFMTPLHLKSEVRWQVSLKFRLEGTDLDVRGEIRWSQMNQDQWWSYGVEADPEESYMRSKVIRALNRRLLRMYPQTSKFHEMYGRAYDMRAFAPGEFRLKVIQDD